MVYILQINLVNIRGHLESTFAACGNLIGICILSAEYSAIR